MVNLTDLTVLYIQQNNNNNNNTGNLPPSWTILMPSVCTHKLPQVVCIAGRVWSDGDCETGNIH